MVYVSYESPGTFWKEKTLFTFDTCKFLWKFWHILLNFFWFEKDTVLSSIGDTRAVTKDFVYITFRSLGISGDLIRFFKHFKTCKKSELFVWWDWFCEDMPLTDLQALSEFVCYVIKFCVCHVISLRREHKSLETQVNFFPPVVRLAVFRPEFHVQTDTDLCSIGPTLFPHNFVKVGTYFGHWTSLSLRFNVV